jgi:glucose-1-phosphate thymidylyltransferase
MKGLILAGGSATRMKDLCITQNKHLLPIHDKPMIYYPIQTLLHAGITEILVTSSPQHIGDIAAQLGDGSRFNATFTYKVQEVPGGIAHALGLAKDFTNGEDLAVILGDNIFDPMPLKTEIELFKNRAGPKCHLFFKRMENPQRFGVPVFTDDGMLISIDEKPTFPKSNYAVTGLYFYDAKVFDIIRGLSPSKRGELEVTDINNRYVQNGSATYTKFSSFWHDAGTIDSLAICNAYYREIGRK